MADESDLPDYADLYPEIASGGLSGALQPELDLLGVGLRASWAPAPGNPGWSRVERGPRSAQVACALAERLFMADLWGEGVLYFNFQTDSLSKIALAISVWLSEQMPSGEETEERCPFMQVTASARAYERGEGIEAEWQRLLAEDPAPHSYRAMLGALGVMPLIERAAAEPKLRQLFPYTSHETLRFSRWVGFPFSADLPYATPTSPTGESFIVFRAGDVFQADDARIGEGDADQAVDLLVRALPDPLEVVYRQPPDVL